MTNMYGYGVISAQRFLVPDPFIDLSDGKYFSRILHQTKQDSVLDRSQLHRFSIHSDFLALIIQHKTADPKYRRLVLCDGTQLSVTAKRCV